MSVDLQLVVVADVGVGLAGQGVLQAGDLFGAVAVFLQDAFRRAGGLGITSHPVGDIGQSQSGGV